MKKKEQGSRIARVAFPPSSSSSLLERRVTMAMVRATYLIRDLINTPACDLTPATLQHAAEDLARQYPDCTSVHTIVGEDLLSYNGGVMDGKGCNMIYTVGRAAASHSDKLSRDRKPRLIEIRYDPTPPQPPSTSLMLSEKNETNKKSVALVGKGVTFDTGGLNLKPGPSMLNMKKDMGGAAHVLGLLSLLTETETPVSVRCLIPAVENALGGDAFRPGDVLTAVNGLTTEVGNTDAEGRLILGDALAIASVERPDLIVDYATLTGAARVELGTDVPPFFTNREQIARGLMDAAVLERDPLWQLPLWSGYEERITKSSKVADLRNIPSDNGLGGAITAALYLKQFVGYDTVVRMEEEEENDACDSSTKERLPWVHIDVYGMNGSTSMGEAQGLRSMFRFIQNL